MARTDILLFGDLFFDAVLFDTTIFADLSARGHLFDFESALSGDGLAGVWDDGISCGSSFIGVSDTLASHPGLSLEVIRLGVSTLHGLCRDWWAFSCSTV